MTSKLIIAAGIMLCAAIFAIGQPRRIDTSANRDKPKPAPESFQAKYEGGMFGFNDKEEGTMKFDDANLRIVFFGKDGREFISIPYETIQIIYPQSKSVTSTTGNVVSHIPLPGAGLAGFIKEKRRYLVVQFEDLVIDKQAVVNFKLETKELLDSVLQTLADKASLAQRGDAFYRPKASPGGSTN